MSTKFFHATQLALTTALLLSFACVHAETVNPQRQQQAAGIQKRILNLDNHLDIPFEFGSGALDASTDGTSQFDLPKVEKGGLKGAVIAIFVPQAARTPDGCRETAEKARKKLAILEGVAAKYPQRVAIAHSPKELKDIEIGPIRDRVEHPQWPVHRQGSGPDRRLVQERCARIRPHP